MNDSQKPPTESPPLTWHSLLLHLDQQADVLTRTRAQLDSIQVAAREVLTAAEHCLVWDALQREEATPAERAPLERFHLACRELSAAAGASTTNEGSAHGLATERVDPRI